MSELVYQRAVNLPQLHDELLAALPQLAGLDETGEVRLRVEGTDQLVTLTVPEDTDRPTVDGVVAVHVPKPDPRPGNRQAMADRATAAIANLQAAAAALDAGTATAAQQRAALALCCRTTARLVRLVLDEFDTAD